MFTKTFFAVLLSSALVVATIVPVHATPTTAADPLEALGEMISAEAAFPALLGSCSSSFVVETLIERRDAIAAAPNLDVARTEALTDTAMVRSALNATWLAAPLSPSIRTARARVIGYEQAVNDAESPQEVSDAFGEFVQLAKIDDDVAVHVGTKGGGCTYSTGETIAIVLGLVLGIIPGLILILLLC